MKILLFKYLTPITLSIPLVLAACSTKTSRGSDQVPTLVSSDGRAKVQDPVAPVVEDPTNRDSAPVQDPKSIPGHFIPYVDEQTNKRSIDFEILKRSERETAQFTGNIFDPTIKPGFQATVENETTYVDGSKVESTETSLVETISNDKFSARTTISTQIGDRKFKVQMQNDCIRSFDRAAGYFVTCGLPELREYPILKDAVEINSNGKETKISQGETQKILISLQGIRNACTFEPNSTLPLVTTERGDYVVTPGITAQNSVKETQDYIGTVTCVNKLQTYKYPAARKLIVIKGYNISNIYKPITSAGVVLFSSDQIETHKDQIYFSRHQIVDIKTN
jgi:hypothetical protein